MSCGDIVEPNKKKEMIHPIRLIFSALSILAATAIYARDETVKDTIEYRAKVWVDRTDLERYGGEEEFRKDLKTMFHNTTRFWNESPNKFDHYFRFVPAEELHVYDIEGDRKRYDEFKNAAYGPMDTAEADFVLFLALDAERGGLSCGGGGASGQSVVMCYIKKTQNIFTDALYPDQGTYSNLGHEYGHVRGATDMYQLIIKAEDNPVSHVDLVPPPCNMGTGYRVWSDYCSALFNYTAHMKQLEPGFQEKIYPAELVISVTEAGKPVRDCKVSLYGTRAGGRYNNRDVYPEAFRVYTTDRKGKVVLTDLYSLYHPDLDDPKVPPKEPRDLFPWSCWFSFLIEAEHDGQKQYHWLPYVELQRMYLEGNTESCEVVFEF